MEVGHHLVGRRYRLADVDLGRAVTFRTKLLRLGSENGATKEEGQMSNNRKNDECNLVVKLSQITVLSNATES